MKIDRAQGFLLGHLAGDAPGSLVEFQSPDEIRRSYPDGVRKLADGGTWNTIAGMRGNSNPDSQANGAMMRISSLGSFEVGFGLDQVAEWAMQDAALTHPNLIFQQANALFAMEIADAIQSGCNGKELYQHIRQWQQTCPLNPLCWIPSTRLPKSRQRIMSTNKAE